MSTGMEDIAAGASKHFWHELFIHLNEWFFLKKVIKPPKNALKIVCYPEQARWNMGTQKGKSVMQLMCRGHVSNIATDVNIKLLRTVLRKTKSEGTVFVKAEKSDSWGNYTILATHMTEIDFHFFGIRPFVKEGQNFKSDIFVYDQFNGRHVIKNVEFRHR